MNTRHRSQRVLATLAILALFVVPAAGASDVREDRISETSTFWSTALNLISPINTWLHEVIDFTGEAAVKNVVLGTEPRVAEVTTQPIEPAKVQGGIDPLGFSRE